MVREIGFVNLFKMVKLFSLALVLLLFLPLSVAKAELLITTKPNTAANKFLIEVFMMFLF